MNIFKVIKLELENLKKGKTLVLNIFYNEFSHKIIWGKTQNGYNQYIMKFHGYNNSVCESLISDEYIVIERLMYILRNRVVKKIKIENDEGVVYVLNIKKVYKKLTDISRLMFYSPSEDCSICYDLLNNSQKVCIINCNHLFHYRCVRNQNNCPICRKYIVSKETVSSEDIQVIDLEGYRELLT